MLPQAPEILRILIVADDPLARAGLAMMFDDDSGIQVVGQVDCAAMDELTWQAFRPDAALWDLGWSPPPESLERLEVLVEQGQSLMPALILLPDADLVAAVWRLGVRGILARDGNAGILATALQAISQGLVVLDSDFSAGISTLTTPLPKLTDPLTPREMEVVQLLAEGLSNRAIAQRLEISPHTVKFHVNSLMGKLDAQSRTEVVVKATRLGLILL